MSKILQHSCMSTFKKSLPRLLCYGPSMTRTCNAFVHKKNYSVFDKFGEALQRFRFKYMFTARHHLDHDQWAKIFCIEGNVGAGKEEFGKKFAELLDLKFYPDATVDYHIECMRQTHPDEFVDHSLSKDSVLQQMCPLSLEHFLMDPEDWPHTAKYQLVLLQNRCFQYCDVLAHLIQTGQGVTCVRHFFSDMVHADAQRKMGWLRKDIHEYYELVALKANENLLRPQVVFYLDVSPEECYERLQAGDNVAEKHIPLEYLKRVEDAYKNTYIPKAQEFGVNVVELDWADEHIGVQEVIDDLTDSDVLKLTGPWQLQKNHMLKYLMRRCQDKHYRSKAFSIYTPVEELWLHPSCRNALDADTVETPFKYPKGLNKELGDKYIFLK